MDNFNDLKSCVQAIEKAYVSLTLTAVYRDKRESPKLKLLKFRHRDGHASTPSSLSSSTASVTPSSLSAMPHSSSTGSFTLSPTSSSGSRTWTNVSNAWRIAIEISPLQISRLIHSSLKYKHQLCVFFFVLGTIYFYHLFFSIDVWLMTIIDFIYSITISKLLQLLPPRVPFGDFLFCCGQGSNCVYLVVLLYHRKNTVLIIVECYFDFSYCYDLLLLLFIDVRMLVLEVCSVTWKLTW